MSEIFERVRATIDAVGAEPPQDGLRSLLELAALEPEELLPALFIAIEDAADGLDLDRVVPTRLLSDPTIARAVTQAVLDRDVPGLEAVVRGGYSELLPVLVATVISLERSRA